MTVPTLEWTPDDYNGGWTAELGIIALSVELGPDNEGLVVTCSWMGEYDRAWMPDGTTVQQAKARAVDMGERHLLEALESLKRWRLEQ